MILESFVLGLSQGLICMGICFPVMGLFLLGKEQSFSSSGKLLVLFLAGRLSGYLVFALISALLGKALWGMPFLNFLFPCVYFLLGLLMVVYGLSRFSFPGHFCHYLNRTYDSPFYILFVGWVTGINLCPPFMGLFVLSVEKADIGKSLLSFSSFFAATSLYLIPLVFLSRLTKRKTVRHSAALASFAAGIYFMVKAFL